jgi:hypothetical protein
MSILSGIGQEPSIFGTGGGGGELVFYYGTIITNLSNPDTTVSAFPSQNLGAGVFLVSFQVIITNLDTAPIDISECNIILVQSASLVGIQQQPEFTLQPAQAYSCVFTAVVYNISAIVPPTSNNIYVSVSSGAFATTSPTIKTDNVTIVKIV